MKNFMKPVTLGLLTCVLSSLCLADIAVIANSASPLTSIDEETAEKVFLKKVSDIRGFSVTPLDLPKGEVRNRFYERIADKSAAQMLAYWSRLIFTGKGAPPDIVISEEDMLSMISAQPEAIGYIDAENLDGRVKKLLILKE